MRNNVVKSSLMSSSELVSSDHAVEAYITKSGNFFWLKSSNAGMSKQIQEKVYFGRKYVSPPYSFEELGTLIEISGLHFRCVKAKAGDVAAEYSIIPVEGVESPNEDDKKRLLNFFEYSEEQEEPFLSLLEKALIDMETFGRGSIEITRNLSGDPAAMWHIPGKTVYSARQDSGYYQKIGTRSAYFQKFPGKCSRKNNSIEWNLKNLQGETSKEGVSIFDCANELLAFELYHPGSSYYGIPDHIPAIGSMVGNLAVEDYNFQLFFGESLPAYVVIAEGGRINADDRTLIESYFKTAKSKGSTNVLVLSVPGKDVRIKVEKLDQVPKSNYLTGIKKESRTDILIAHGVPPVRLGIADAGAGLGGTRDLIQLQAYYSGTIQPRRTRLLYICNEVVIKRGFGITDWEMSFKGLDIRDQKTESEIYDTYVEREILTRDEVRAELGREPLPVSTPASSEQVMTVPDSTIDFMVEMEEDEKVVGERLLKSVQMDVTRGFYFTWENKIPKFTSATDVDLFVEDIGKDLFSVVEAKMPELVRITQKRLKMMGFKISDEVATLALQSNVLVKYREWSDKAWLKDAKRVLQDVVSAPEVRRPLLMKMAENQLKGRSHLYGGIYNYGINSVVKDLCDDAKLDLFWALGSKDPCPDCLARAEASPFKAGTLKHVPGDGTTRCLGNCCCFLMPVR